MQKQGSKPLLIAVGGLSGSGKTSLARALLAGVPNAVHLDSDRTRKELFGVSETTRLPPEAYSSQATFRLIKEMERRVKAHIAAGQSVIVSTTFQSAKSRHEQEKLAQETGAKFIGLWLQADLSVLFDRVAKRVGDASDAGVDIVKMQASRSAGDIAWPVINADQSREEVINAAVKIISAKINQPRPAVCPKPR